MIINYLKHMKNTLKKSSILLVLILTLAGCTTTPSTEKTVPSTNNETVSWKTYNSQKLSFSIEIPEKILSDNLNDKSWTALNIFEDDHNVYFTTHSSEETLQNKSWEFKVGGTTVNNKDEIIPFLESYYEVKGCQIEFNKDENSGFFNLPIFAKDSNLMPDGQFACFIGGKVRSIYDEISGKLITYQIVEPFFSTPEGNVSEESLASLKFTP